MIAAACLLLASAAALFSAWHALKEDDKASFFTFAYLAAGCLVFAAIVAALS